MFGFLKQRVIPLYTYGSMTRPLTGDEQATLGGEPEWGLVSTDPMGSSVRRTRDHRILLRNTVSAGCKPQTTAKQRTDASAITAAHSMPGSPSSARFRFKYSWAGLMGA